MKQFIFLSFILFLVHNIIDAQAFHWQKSMGTSTNTIEEGKKILVDKHSTLITIGQFSGSIDMDPGSGVQMLHSPGNANGVFIQKLDLNGNFLWAKAIGGNHVISNNMALDKDGNIYITGSYIGNADMDPDSLSSVNYFAPWDAAYILKLDNNGNFIWVKMIESNSYSEGISLAIDSNENVILCGSFTGQVDFDPSINTYLKNSLGFSDAYVAKYSSNGNLIWANVVGGTSFDDAVTLALDSSNNIIYGGLFGATVDFNSGSGVENRTATFYRDIYISKLDKDGNFIWVKTFEGSNTEEISQLSIDKSQSIIAIGSFQGVVDFDPNPGFAYVYSSAGNDDAFFLKLDSNGAYKWARRAGGNNLDYGISLCTDSNNNIFYFGTFSGSMAFTTSYYLMGTLQISCFIAKYDSNGIFKWADGFYGSDQVRAESVCLDNYGAIYTTGYYFGSIDFNPADTATFISTSAGERDIYICKLQQNCGFTQYNSYFECDSALYNGTIYFQDTSFASFYSNINGCDSNIVDQILIHPSSSHYYYQTACDSFQFGGNSITSSGIYNHTFLTPFGCDSNVTLNLTISNTYFDTLNITACDSFNFNGTIYTGSGTYNQVLTSVGGCDSNVLLNLTFFYSPIFYATIGGCDTATFNGLNYTANGTYVQWYTSIYGCDSSWVLDVIISNTSKDTITASTCSDYTLNGITYSLAGTYNQHLVNTQGCDSTLTLNLSIIPLNNAVSQTGNILTAMLPGAVYQWVECPNYDIILGATNQVYTSNTNGNFAVILYSAGCIDTSSCYTVTGVNTNDYSMDKNIRLSPSPVHDFINITSLNKLHDSAIEILSMDGIRICSWSQLNGSNFSYDVSNLPPGVYILNVIENSEFSRIKFIKL